MNETKSYSMRLSRDNGERLAALAKAEDISISALLGKWTVERLAGITATPVKANDSDSLFGELELERLETLICRATWAVIVALSPTLDETASAETVNDLIKPTRTDWIGE